MTNPIDADGLTTSEPAAGAEREELHAQNQDEAMEFCKGAFRPFVADVRHYAKLVAELLDQATDRALATPHSPARSALEDIPSDVEWLIGKGKTRPDEPLYGVQLRKAGTDIILAQSEHDDLPTAISMAVAALKGGDHE